MRWQCFSPYMYEIRFIWNIVTECLALTRAQRVGTIISHGQPPGCKSSVLNPERKFVSLFKFQFTPTFATFSCAFDEQKWVRS